MTIYKILLPAEWDAFEAAGEFRGSPLDLADGFVHLSTAEQLPHTIARYFAGRGELVVVAVDESGFGAALKWENDFPHVYAPLPISAVESTRRETAP